MSSRKKLASRHLALHATLLGVARDVVKAEDIIDYTQHEGLPERVLKKFGAAMGAGAVKSAMDNVKPSLR